MKHYLILVLSAFLLLTACEKEDPNFIPKRKDIILTRSGAEIIDASYDFSFNLFKEVAKDKDYRNVFLSPLSALIANCMLANGAGGETYDQIITTIGYEGYSLEDINGTYQTVVKGLSSVDTSTKLGLANSLWLSKNYFVYDKYKKSVVENYGGYVGELDFSSNNSLNDINKWVSQKTGGNVSNILDDFSSDIKVIIANALYFKGKWKEKFNSEQTRRGEFKALDGSTVDKSFMYTSTKLLYGESEDGLIRMCEIPYGNGAFVLDIIVPEESVDFRGFIDSLSGEEWSSLFTYKNTHEVNLYLPKFKIESDLNLNNYLVSLGMNLPYELGKADFTRLSNIPLVINETRQKAIIEVDENGTTAASSTYLKGDWNLLPGPGDVIQFRADHSFMFIIREITSNTVIFIGTLTE